MLDGYIEQVAKMPINVTKLGKVAQILSGFAFKSEWFQSVGTPVIRIGDISNEGISSSVGVAVDESNYKIPSNCRTKEGDILMALSGATTGKIGVVKEDSEGFFVNQRVAIVRSSESITQRYLQYIFNGQILKILLNQAWGAAQANLSPNALKELVIPFPTLEEQRHIAEILDRADAIRRKRQEAIALTEELLRSTFLEMFGDPVTNPKGWETKLFSDVGTLERGKSKHRPRNEPSLLGGSYPLIQTGDITNCDGLITNFHQTYSQKGLAQSKLWKAKTLCITIAANIAQTGILTFDACFPDSVVGFHPNEYVTTEYVQEWMSFLQPILEESAPQSAQKNINLQILRELELPVPPLALQKNFSRFVTGLYSYNVKNRESIEQLDNLFNSLLQKAFRGEL